MSRKPVILCVDEASSVLEGREMLLEENGYQVLTAADGKEAVQAFVSNTVDLVLLDHHMPQMDGGVVAMHMRACKPDVPIALLSGDEWLPPRALEAVDACISKSEPITSLLEKVDHLLSLRFLFQPLDGSWADEVGAQHKHEVPG
jgi:CheY-like chemotaxis protein